MNTVRDWLAQRPAVLAAMQALQVAWDDDSVGEQEHEQWLDECDDSRDLAEAIAAVCDWVLNEQ